jgi:MFS family permease
MQGFENFFETLPLPITTALVALVSIGLVWILCAVFPVRLGLLWAVLVPFVVAYCAYWFPVWRGADASEYGAWSVLVIGIWFTPGFLGSAILVRLLTKRRARLRAKEGATL